MIITSHTSYSLRNSIIQLYFSFFRNRMQKWKDVNSPLTFNIISMKTGSLPWHSPLTKQRFLPSLREEILRSMAESKERKIEAENGEDRRQLEQDIYSAVAQTSRRIGTEFQRGGWWFSFTHPQHQNPRPNNFSILLSSRYPVISHHLYVFSRSTGYPCPFVTARGKTHDTPFPISLHIFSFENVLSLSTFLCTFTSKVQVFIFLSNLEIGKKYLGATVSIIF